METYQLGLTVEFICTNCGKRIGVPHTPEEIGPEICPRGGVRHPNHIWVVYTPEPSHTTRYLRDCLVTESSRFPEIIERLGGDNPRLKLRLLHSFMGLATESGELLDALKKHLFYGKPLDPTNLKEELGDLLWYVSIALDALGLSYEQVMDTNIAKLKTRYQGAFDAAKAVGRDLGAERKTLEK